MGRRLSVNVNIADIGGAKAHSINWRDAAAVLANRGAAALFACMSAAYATTALYNAVHSKDVSQLTDIIAHTLCSKDMLMSGLFAYWATDRFGISLPTDASGDQAAGHPEADREGR